MYQHTAQYYLLIKINGKLVNTKYFCGEKR